MNIPRRTLHLNADVWGKHYWFFLHTIAYKYAEHPNAVTKRKYYDLISNFPLFIPDEEIGNYFAQLLDKYPVTPYLDNRESFIRWVWFIHNKINRFLMKEEIGLFESLDKYLEQYNISTDKGRNKWFNDKNLGKHFWFFVLLFIFVALIIYLSLK